VLQHLSQPVQGSEMEPQRCGGGSQNAGRCQDSTAVSGTMALTCWEPEQHSWAARQDRFKAFTGKSINRSQKG